MGTLYIEEVTDEPKSLKCEFLSPKLHPLLQILKALTHITKIRGKLTILVYYKNVPPIIQGTSVRSQCLKGGIEA